jgi:hypothetical protein
VGEQIEAGGAEPDEFNACVDGFWREVEARGADGSPD